MEAILMLNVKRCPYCNGEGYYPYEDVEGSSKIGCLDCDGRGWIEDYDEEESEFFDDTSEADEAEE